MFHLRILGNMLKTKLSELLDEAALKTIRRVNPFRPLPDELGKESWALAVPIAFTLKD